MKVFLQEHRGLEQFRLAHSRAWSFMKGKPNVFLSQL